MADFSNAKLKKYQGKEIKSRQYASELQTYQERDRLSMPKIALNNNFLANKLDKLKNVRNIYMNQEQPVFIKFERFGKNFEQ